MMRGGQIEYALHATHAGRSDVTCRVRVSTETKKKKKRKTGKGSRRNGREEEIWGGGGGGVLPETLASLDFSYEWIFTPSSSHDPSIMRR